MIRKGSKYSTSTNDRILKDISIIKTAPQKANHPDLNFINMHKRIKISLIKYMIHNKKIN